MSARSPAGLADPALRRVLVDYVKRRVAASDVDDVVQTVLCDALEANDRPDGGDALRRWMLGVARHKVVDLHRKKGREPLLPEDAEVPDPALEAPLEERAMADWAAKQVGDKPDAQRTLGILAREGEGEKLESIAADERLPPATVRQRVSRMRKFLRDRWKAELALVAAMGVLVFFVWRAVRAPDVEEARRDPPVGPSAEPPELQRAAELRREAKKSCDEKRWAICLRSLDDARSLDPAGDRAPDVAALRKLADDALKAPPPPPTSSAEPRPIQQDAPAPEPTESKRNENKNETKNETKKDEKPTFTPPKKSNDQKQVKPAPKPPATSFGPPPKEAPSKGGKKFSAEF